MKARRILADINSFARLGNQVSRSELAELVSLEADLRQAREKAEVDTESEGRASC